MQDPNRIWKTLQTFEQKKKEKIFQHLEFLIDLRLKKSNGSSQKGKEVDEAGKLFIESQI